MRKVVINAFILIFCLVKPALSFGYSIDVALLSELEQGFSNYSHLNFQQYLQLKANRDAKLLQAQRLVFQYLQSTPFQVMPETTSLTDLQWQQIVRSQNHLYANPVMFQTGLEILSNELMLPLQGRQTDCRMVGKTLRFLSYGVGKDQTTSKMKSLESELIIMHIYAAFIGAKSFSQNFPCVEEFANIEIAQVKPELKCPPRTNQICSYFDRESIYAIARLAGEYTDQKLLYFEGLVAPKKQHSLWGKKSTYLMGSYFLDGPQRSWKYSFEIPKQSKSPIASKLETTDENMNSIEAMQNFAELGALITQ